MAFHRTPEVILDIRVNDAGGFTEYYVKWADTPWGSNNACEWVRFWEVAGHQRLIADFENVSYPLFVLLPNLSSLPSGLPSTVQDLSAH